MPRAPCCVWGGSEGDPSAPLLTVAHWPQGLAVPGWILPQGVGWLDRCFSLGLRHSPVSPRRVCGFPGCWQQAQTLLWRGSGLMAWQAGGQG